MSAHWNRFWLLISTITLWVVGLGAKEVRIVCYYTNWSVYRPGDAKFDPQNINPYLCTHIIYAFGSFTKENTLKPFDKYQDIEKGGYAKFAGLKTYNKNLKTLLAIGGWNEGSTRFSPMVANAERRKELIKNAIKFLRQNHFDGLDLDWEYPSFRDGGKPRDRDNYAQLVQELREEFDRESEKTGRPRLLLTMAVPAGIEYINKGYDIPKLNEYLDWMNILSYDYHSAYEPAINHHSPLYPLEEENEYSLDIDLNVDYTIKHYIKKGADKSKLVLGIPTYGRSYTLYNPDANEIGSPADGPGEMGEATRENGYLAYYEICENLKSNDWIIEAPYPDAMGPYAYKDNQWVAYDDEDIARKKAEYVAKNGLGGVMIWSIDNDDFRGKCGDRPYPIAEAAKEALLKAYGLTDANLLATTKKPLKTRTKTRGTTKSIEATTESSPAVRIRPNSRRKNVNRVTDESKPGLKRRPSNRRNKKKQESTTSSESSLVVTPSYTTPAPPTTPDGKGIFKCEEDGFFSHPKDCQKYFFCLAETAHQYICPGELYFNKATNTCDYPRNVLCNKKLRKATTTTTTTTTPAPSSTSVSTRRPPPKITAATSRTTFTTTPPPDEDDYEEYEDEEEEEVVENGKVAEEDPRVIKELIELIKKAGGIEELEKQLKIADSGTTTGGNLDSTTRSSILNKSLYERVLGRASATLNEQKKSTFKTYNTIGRNSRGPQNEGLEQSSQSPIRSRPQYTSIVRSRPSTEATEEKPTKEQLEKQQEEEPEEISEKPGRFRSPFRKSQPEYVTIRRQRITTTTEISETDENLQSQFKQLGEAGDDSEDEEKDSKYRSTTSSPYVTIRRSRPTTEASKDDPTTKETPPVEESLEDEKLRRHRLNGTEESVTTSRYVEIRSRGTTTTTTSSPETKEESSQISIDESANSVEENTVENTDNNNVTEQNNIINNTDALKDVVDNIKEIISIQKKEEADEKLPVLSDPRPFSINHQKQTTTEEIPKDQAKVSVSSPKNNIPEARVFNSKVSSKNINRQEINSEDENNNDILGDDKFSSKHRFSTEAPKETPKEESQIIRIRGRGQSRFTGQTVATTIRPRPVIRITEKPYSDYEGVEYNRKYRPDIAAEIADLSSLLAVDLKDLNSGRKIGRRRRPIQSTTQQTTPSTTTELDETQKTGSRTLPLARKLLDGAQFGRANRFRSTTSSTTKSSLISTTETPIVENQTKEEISEKPIKKFRRPFTRNPNLLDNSRLNRFRKNLNTTEQKPEQTTERTTEHKIEQSTTSSPVRNFPTRRRIVLRKLIKPTHTTTTTTTTTTSTTTTEPSTTTTEAVTTTTATTTGITSTSPVITTTTVSTTTGRESVEITSEDPQTTENQTIFENQKTTEYQKTTEDQRTTENQRTTEDQKTTEYQKTTTEEQLKTTTTENQTTTETDKEKITLPNEILETTLSTEKENEDRDDKEETDDDKSEEADDNEEGENIKLSESIVRENSQNFGNILEDGLKPGKFDKSYKSISKDIIFEEKPTTESVFSVRTRKIIRKFTTTETPSTIESDNPKFKKIIRRLKPSTNSGNSLSGEEKAIEASTISLLNKPRRKFNPFDTDNSDKIEDQRRKYGFKRPPVSIRPEKDNNDDETETIIKPEIQEQSVKTFKPNFQPKRPLFRRRKIPPIETTSGSEEDKPLFIRRKFTTTTSKPQEENNREIHLNKSLYNRRIPTFTVYSTTTTTTESSTPNSSENNEESTLITEAITDLIDDKTEYKKEDATVENVSSGYTESTTKVLDEETTLRDLSTVGKDEESFIETTFKNEDTTLNNQDTTVNDQDTTINDQDTTINNQETTTADKETTLNDLSTVGKEEESFIETTFKTEDTTLNNQDTTLNNQDTTLNNQDTTINNNEFTINNEEIFYSEKETTLKDNDTTTKEYTTLTDEETTLKDDETTLKITTTEDIQEQTTYKPKIESSSVNYSSTRYGEASNTTSVPFTRRGRLYFKNKQYGTNNLFGNTGEKYQGSTTESPLAKLLHRRKELNKLLAVKETEKKEDQTESEKEIINDTQTENESENDFLTTQEKEEITTELNFELTTNHDSEISTENTALDNLFTTTEDSLLSTELKKDDIITTTEYLTTTTTTTTRKPSRLFRPIALRPKFTGKKDFSTSTTPSSLSTTTERNKLNRFNKFKSKPTSRRFNGISTTTESDDLNDKEFKPSFRPSFYRPINRVIPEKTQDETEKHDKEEIDENEEKEEENYNNKESDDKDEEIDLKEKDIEDSDEYVEEDLTEVEEKQKPKPSLFNRPGFKPSYIILKPSTNIEEVDYEDNEKNKEDNIQTSTSKPSTRTYKKFTTPSPVVITQNLSDINITAVNQRNKHLFNKTRKMNTPFPNIPIKTELNTTTVDGSYQQSLLTSTKQDEITEKVTSTTEKVTTLHHIFAETTQNPDEVKTFSEDTKEKKIEKIVEINRIVKVTAKVKNGTNVIETEGDEKPDKSRLLVSRVTEIKVVEGQNGTNETQRQDRKYETKSKSDNDFNIPISSVNGAQANQIQIDSGSSVVQKITPKPFYSVETATIPLEGLFQTNPPKIDLQNELLEGENSNFVNVRILQQDNHNKLSRMATNAKFIPVRILKDEEEITMKADVIEVTPSASNQQIRIVPISVSIQTT